MTDQEPLDRDVNRMSRTWTTLDLAWFFQVSESKARQLAETPGFPNPTRLPGGRLLRWDPQRVVAWWEDAQDPDESPAPEPEPEPAFIPPPGPRKRRVGRPPKE